MRITDDITGRAVERGLLFVTALIQHVLIGTAVLVMLSPCVTAQTRDDLKIVEEIWGFDGRVQPGQFNPVSILVDNLSEDAVEANATFSRSMGLLTTTGGLYAQQVYIAPHSRRWIQFYPYIASTYGAEWKLKINDAIFDGFTQPRAAFTLETNKQDVMPQAVIMDAGDTQTRQPTTVKHFPENIFPPYSTATFGLHTVFMDHAPDWEVPRQQAFMSWLRQGGQLHLLKNRRGEYPRFSGELAGLSEPFETFRIGSGRVTRHDIQRDELSRSLVDSALAEGSSSVVRDDLDAAIETQKNYGNTMFTQINPSQMDDSLFQDMRQMTQPEHAWWLIFLLAICYIGLIFPGCWIVSQKKELHFLTTYAAVAVVSIVFSLLFLLIGRRGYGESTSMHSIAIARAEDATHLSILQWNALFVTSGRAYTANAPDTESVFSTGITDRRVSAQMVAGNNGFMKMDIPPFSSQTFVTRRRIRISDWNLQLKEVSASESGLLTLKLSANDQIPVGNVVRYQAIFGRRVYRLQFDPATRVLSLIGAVSPLSQYVDNLQAQSYTSQFGYFDDGLDDRTFEDRFYEESLRTLIGRSLLDDIVYKPADFKLPADRVRLLIYAPMPDELQVPTDTRAEKAGRVLYVRDVFLQENLQSGSAESP